MLAIKCFTAQVSSLSTVRSRVEFIATRLILEWSQITVASLKVVVRVVVQLVNLFIFALTSFNALVSNISIALGNNLAVIIAAAQSVNTARVDYVLAEIKS
jgi:hypothetical protein